MKRYLTLLIICGIMSGCVRTENDVTTEEYGVAYALCTAMAANLRYVWVSPWKVPTGHKRITAFCDAGLTMELIVKEK